MNPIEMHGVTYGYDASPVLDNLYWQVTPGQIVGLLGKNGAGKTTLLHNAVGLFRPTQGQADLFGQPAWNASASTKARVGFVGQQWDSFNWMSGQQCLDYMRGFYPNWDPQWIKQLVDEWDIDTVSVINRLSVGQQQRLAVVAALGHRPDLLVLDEPVASLDPQGRRLFIQQLLEMNLGQHTSVVFSSHITSDVERIASHIALLHQGKLCYQGELDNLKEQVMRFKVKANSDDVLPLSSANVLEQQWQGQYGMITVQGMDSADLTALGLIIEQQLPLNLEEIYLELSR